MPLIPQLDQHRTEPLFIQIYEYIKEEIRSGRLAPQTKLPSIRELADQLNISRSPVEAAYQELLAEGYIESQPRRGLFVLNWEEGGIPLAPTLPAHKHAGPTSSAQHESVRPPGAPSDLSPVSLIDFGFDHMATELFPYAIWRKLAISLLQPAHKALFHYGDPQGEIGLREQIAKWLRETRGILCSPSQIIITSGTQHSLIWLSWLLPESKEPKGSLAVEEAIHDGIRKLWQRQGFTLTPIELDNEGISVRTLSSTDIRQVYVTPSHQFPYGIDMTLTRRKELLEWARQTESLIVEDDYDHEFRFAGPPVHSLFSLSEKDNVIYIGTFSKALAPSLRMGYIVLPKHLLQDRDQQFGSYDQPVSRLQQKTMEEFMRQGYLDKHLRRMKGHYSRKRETLLAEIDKRMGKYVTVQGTSAGLHVVLTSIAAALTEDELVQRAADLGVKVYPSTPYRLSKEDKPPSILLGFGGLSPEQIRKGCRLLSEAWFS